MADLDWQHVAVQSGASIVSGLSGLLFGIWRWGRKSAQHEQGVKDDYDGKIKELRDEMRDDVNHVEKAMTAARDLLVEQFQESFSGIRRQIDEVRLDTEKRFLQKDDFKDFREEYRDDMRDLKTSISEIARSKG